MVGIGEVGTVVAGVARAVPIDIGGIDTIVAGVARTVTVRILLYSVGTEGTVVVAVRPPIAVGVVLALAVEASLRLITARTIGVAGATSGRCRLDECAAADPARTDVAAGTNVDVVANGGVVDVGTADCLIAGVVGTDVPVVAGKHRPALTNAIAATVRLGASVAIVTRNAVLHVDVFASSCWVALIRRTDLVVVTVERSTTATGPAYTGVHCRADVGVTADVGVIIFEDATRNRIAAIVSADVPVVAGNGRSGNTLAAAADITVGASASVTARIAVVDEAAASFRIARIVRALVVVVAIQGLPGLAFPVLANFHTVAEIAIRTRRLVHDCFVGTSRHRVTAINRALVVVVAVERRKADANAVVADVFRGANRAVIAGTVVVQGDAPANQIARVIGADVVVAASERRSFHASAILAGLPAVADVAVGAIGVARARRCHVVRIVFRLGLPALAALVLDALERRGAVRVAITLLGRWLVVTPEERRENRETHEHKPNCSSHKPPPPTLI